jgi:hypothetical protein
MDRASNSSGERVPKLATPTIRPSLIVHDAQTPSNPPDVSIDRANVAVERVKHHATRGLRANTRKRRQIRFNRFVAR